MKHNHHWKVTAMAVYTSEGKWAHVGNFWFTFQVDFKNFDLIINKKNGWIEIITPEERKYRFYHEKKRYNK